MEYEELARKLEYYPIGTVFNLKWDRGNGEISHDFVYFGRKDEGIPVLRRYEETRKSLEEYSEDVVFDISNPDLNITDVVVIMHKSDKLIGD